MMAVATRVLVPDLAQPGLDPGQPPILLRLSVEELLDQVLRAFPG